MDLGHDDTAAIAQGMTEEAGNNGEPDLSQGNCLTHTQTLLGESIQGLGPPSFVTKLPG